MTHVLGTLLSACVTILMVLFYTVTMFLVSAQRGKHGVKAPSCSGPAEFERAYRVQMNTLEQFAITLPLFWLATLYAWTPAIVVPAIGVIWVAGRVIYLLAYMADPAKRGTGMMIGMLCNVALLILALIGIFRVWVAVSAIS